MTAVMEKQIYQLFINNKPVEGQSGKMPVYNPATGEEIGQLAIASEADVDAAVIAARTAFEGVWAKTSASKRTKLLMKVSDLIRAKADELARWESLNSGKAFGSAKGEILSSAEYFEYFAGAATKIQGSTVPVPSNLVGFTQLEPVGVCAQIIPWNYPFMMAAWKLAPALAAGCTVVLKPSEHTPFTALMLAEICREAGIPDGVVNIVHGLGPTVGAYLAGHPGVDKVAFTGGTETGKAIMAIASQTLKRVTLELGGKSPNIVFDDANLDDAVNCALFGIYYSAGQSCEARSRLFLHDAIYDQFMEKFMAKVSQIRIGDPLDPNTQVGSLISPEHLAKVDGYVRIAEAEGAKVLYGGQRMGGDLAKGCFFQPTVLTDVTNEMKVAQEEIFGPVVCVIRFKDEKEVVKMANNVSYGLYATIWTRDVGRAHRLASAVKAGGVSVNTPFTAMPGLPFGGYKQSGIGRELSMDSLKNYCEEKSVLIYTGDRPLNPFGL